ncbi:hypothetical protein KIW84_023559 [Lathyrus oleraceus]|uniref:Uncharacterized protein n=1 Tax=Pisum sativum TaxID=3888 RepID=A0A9D4YHS2_PEA|nr:hypothetical protein KIW84_023559 [Pisum sativum]
MDSGWWRPFSKTDSRVPFQERFLHQKNSSQDQDNLDRCIPNRSAMDFGYAHYMLTEGTKGKENPEGNSFASSSIQIIQTQTTYSSDF